VPAPVVAELRSQWSGGETPPTLAAGTAALRFNIPVFMRYIILVLLLVSASAVTEAEPILLTSPNGDLAIRFQTIDSHSNAAPTGQLVYDVSFRGKSLLNPSALSLTLAGQKPLGGTCA
jgi:hypothetical protein